MSFLAMILGVLLLQLWSPQVPVHRDQWFDDLRDWLGRHLRSPLWLTVWALVIPAFLVSWGLDLIRPLLFGLAWIALAGLVLVYSFGRGDYPGLAAGYRRHCLEGDFEAAYLSLGEQLTGAQSPMTPTSTREFQGLAQRALLYAGFQRWFPVLLYFLLLGPEGALLYRLAQLGRERSEAEVDHTLVAVLDWLPSRLLALTFAVTGDFVRSRAVLGRELFTDEPAAVVLHRVASAAVGAGAGEAEDGASAARDCGELTELLSRSAVLWLVVIAVAELVF
jgi:AmpE protein